MGVQRSLAGAVGYRKSFQNRKCHVAEQRWENNHKRREVQIYQSVNLNETERAKYELDKRPGWKRGQTNKRPVKSAADSKCGSIGCPAQQGSNKK